MQSRLVNKILPNHWGYSTKWEYWTSSTGWIDDIAPKSYHANGWHEISPEIRARTSSEVKLKNGLRGFSAAALFAGLVDGVTQAISDWNLCLSRAEKLFRFCVAVALGITVGLLASGFFALGVGVVALKSLAITATGKMLIPILAGLGASLWGGIGANYLKDEYIFKVFSD